MARRPVPSILALSSIFVIGCNDAEMRQQLDDLSSRLDSLQTEINTLKADVQSVRRKQTLSEIKSGFDEVAYLTPGSDGYSIIKTSLGYITVSLEDVKSYANGSRVTLQLGNTTSATITGARATIQWGSVDNDGIPNYETEKEREVSFTQNLQFGSWTKVQVVLEGVPPTALGYVRVKDFRHTGIRLLVK